MTTGIVTALAGCLGFAIYLYDMRLAWHVVKTPAARATIVSTTQKHAGGKPLTDALLDYERQSPAGPVHCQRAPMSFAGPSETFAVGKQVDVYPQDGSCYRPIYAPDIGHPLAVILFSSVAFPCGLAIFGATLASSRRRRRQFED
jgi:hypothetical protein